jgi:hypothetical protein
MRHKPDIWDDATLQECCKFPRYSALIVQLLIKKCHYSYHLMNQCLSIIALTPPLHTCCFSLFFTLQRCIFFPCIDAPYLRRVSFDRPLFYPRTFANRSPWSLIVRYDPGISFFRGERSTVPLCPTMSHYVPIWTAIVGKESQESDFCRAMSRYAL